MFHGFTKSTFRKEKPVGNRVYSHIAFEMVDFEFLAERRSNNENVFHLQVYESLLAVTRNPDLIQRNVDVPYGYFVDFVIALNKSDEITDRFGGSISTQ